MTIDVLPDNVLLETFEFYLGKDYADKINYGHNYDGWQTLVHVCRRWRCIVFASPRRLDLKLYCTRQRSANSKTLDVWPALPIVIFVKDLQSKEGVTNTIAALRQHNRVCKIDYCEWRFQDSLLKEFAAIDEPFPALTSLQLSSMVQQNVPVLPDSFLGGSAPRLRSLVLDGIPYPAIGKLLSTTTNLVKLSLWHIPHSGYFAPQTIVPCLYMLPRLKSLLLGFQYHHRSWAERASRHPPPLTRVVFPNLTCLNFRGDIEYLEGILSQIETPMLNEIYFCFFNQLVFDTPLLGHFIRRTGTLLKIDTARVEFSSWAAAVVLSGKETAINSGGALHLEITCKPFDWQVSAVAQVLNSFLSSLLTLESLWIIACDGHWQGEIEVIQWREFLHPFTSVKDVNLESANLVRLVAPALQELARERETEVLLPALQNLRLRMCYGWRPSGPVKEAIEEFITTRRLCGHPVTLHF